jgi:membrane protein DedA with SNARE-associated domain
MISKIISILSLWVLGVISKIGYLGVFGLMFLESANIPIPSEVTMPFAGFLVSSGRFNLWLLILVGALGNLFGSWLSYCIAYLIGEPLSRFFKKSRFFSDDYEKAERFFQKYGLVSVFWSRLLPVVRTFISFPAGIFKVSFWKFSYLTFIGSLIWSGILTWVGFYLGDNWSVLGGYFHKFDYVIVILGIILVGYYIYSKIRKPKPEI